METEAMNIKTKGDAFRGMSNWNGLNMKQEFNKTDGKPIIGASGKSMRFMSTNCNLYLEPNQYDIIK